MSIASDIFHIYQLVDPRDNLPFYVGYTGDLEQRFRQHLAGDLSNEAKSERIVELQRLGLTPIIQELETVKGRVSDAIQRESYWINQRVKEGMPLLNGSQRKRGSEAFEQTHERFTFWLAADLKQGFKALAEEQGAAKTTLLNEAIADLLKKYNEGR